jgi:hypothetical protein
MKGFSGLINSQDEGILRIKALENDRNPGNLFIRRILILTGKPCATLLKC